MQLSMITRAFNFPLPKLNILISSLPKITFKNNSYLCLVNISKRKEHVMFNKMV